MDYYSGIVYGIIQGLTEFFPISSSGHLALLPKVLHIKDPGVLFDLMMHVGTALAVCVYFNSRLLSIINGALCYIKKTEHPAKEFSLNFILSTLCSVVFILLFKGVAFEYGRSSTLIAWNLIIFGVLMWVSDLKKGNGSDVMNKREGKLNAIFIGFSQSLAIFPGVSRSGITLTCGRFLGLNRHEATEFSFLLSLPIIFGGALLKLKSIENMGSDSGLIFLFVGVLVSFLVGLVAIHTFIKLVERVGLWGFTVYRLILGVLVLLFIN